MLVGNKKRNPSGSLKIVNDDETESKVLFLIRCACRICKVISYTF